MGDTESQIAISVNGRCVVLTAFAFVAGIKEILAATSEYLDPQQYAESVAVVFSLLERQGLASLTASPATPHPDTSGLVAHMRSSLPSASEG